MSHGCGVAKNGVKVREEGEGEVASTKPTAQGSLTAKRGACEAVNSERFVDVFAVAFGRVGGVICCMVEHQYSSEQGVRQSSP